MDLITYTIEALKQGSRPLQVREAAPGSGHLCGSTYLNRIFAKYMTDRFSDRFGWSNELLKEAIKVFDTETKRRFQGRAGDAYYDIPVNGLTDDPAAGISRNSLRLPRHIVREIFKPVIDEIKTLVLNQMRTSTSPVKFIVLVGGFGSNTYLRSELRAVVGDTVHLWCAANR